jgi:hypothetical protein
MADGVVGEGPQVGDSPQQPGLMMARWILEPPKPVTVIETDPDGMAILWYMTSGTAIYAESYRIASDNDLKTQPKVPLVLSPRPARASMRPFAILLPWRTISMASACNASFWASLPRAENCRKPMKVLRTEVATKSFAALLSILPFSY